MLVFADGDRSHGPDGRRDRRHRRGAQLNVELGAEPPGLHRQRRRRRQGDRDHRHRLLPDARPSPTGSARRTATADGRPASAVLLVDDSAFFRNLLAPLLSAAGYRGDRGRQRRQGAGAVRGRRGVRHHRQRHRDAGHERLRVLPRRCARAAAGRTRRWWRCRRTLGRATWSGAARSASTTTSPSIDRDGLLHTLNSHPVRHERCRMSVELPQPRPTAPHAIGSEDHRDYVTMTIGGAAVRHPGPQRAGRAGRAADHPRAAGAAGGRRLAQPARPDRHRDRRAPAPRPAEARTTASRR